MEFYEIPGSNEMKISDALQVVDKDGNPATCCELLGKKIDKSVEWLYGISRICGKIDEFDLDNLEFAFNPNSRSKIPWFTYYKKPKYLDGNLSEYRVVPGYVNLAVSSWGDVVDVERKFFYKTTISHGYPHVYCKIFRYGKHLFVPTYKLVALAWCHNPDPINLVAIDHTDGNKKNNVWTNLKWVTYKENSVNAVSQGLIQSAVGGRVRDITTGKITEFSSLESLNEFLGMRAKEINHFLTRRRNNVYGGKYEVRIDGDDRPWVYTDKCQNVEPSRYIITVHEKSGDKVFNGVRTFINHYKLWDIGTPSCAHAVDAFQTQFPGVRLSVIDQYDLSPVEMKDLTTDEVVTYPDVVTLIKVTGLCKTTVLTAIKYNGRKVVHDKYVFRHKSSDPWPTDLIVIKNKPVELILINKDTRDEIVCSSVKDAARKIGRDREYITRCLKRPKETDKYTVRLNSPVPE